MSDGLELRQVACVRGRRELFRDVDVALAPGQLLRLQGANGAGKTSLLRIACGLLPPERGEVRWRGRPIRRLREEFGRQLVFLGHAAALKDDLSALENLICSSTLAGRPVDAEQARAALAAAGLRGRERLPARVLSQGQRKRVALARLVLSEASPLWVLDEPFNALDSAATAWLLALIGAHVARGGLVALTSHQSVALDPALPQIALTL